MNDEAVACANEARPLTPALPPPHEIVKHDPPAMPPPCEIDKLVAVPDPLSPDMAQVEEDRLNAEAVELERLVRFNLVESAARLLDGDLARAGGPSEKIAVLTRWIARTQRAYAVTAAIIAGRDQAAYERAMRPRPQERRLTIKS